MDKAVNYRELLPRCEALVAGETDSIAVMATLACEVHRALPYAHWTGFYRVTEPGLLKIGPYQGGHGCLTIPFERGVCGKAAREGATQRVADVNELPYHIACSTSTRSEIVVPVFDKRGQVMALLDIDSDDPAAFGPEDQQCLEQLVKLLTVCYP